MNIEKCDRAINYYKIKLRDYEIDYSCSDDFFDSIDTINLYNNRIDYYTKKKNEILN